MSELPDIGVILLAAGNSSRFGHDKRQARMPNGNTVLEESLKNLHAESNHIILAVRQSEPWLEDIVQDYSKTKLLPVSHTSGMGDTLAASARYMAEKTRANYVLIALADMPWIKPATIRDIIRAPKNADIVIPAYQKQWGHPVRLHRKYLDDLQNCSGDKGARALLLRETGSRLIIDVADPGVVRDVDLPADLG